MDNVDVDLDLKSLRYTVHHNYQWLQDKEKTGPEEAQYFHVRPPIGFI